MIDEKALFRLVTEGDKEAFRQLFHHYNKMLQPFVVRLTRSPHAAEEVLQEVFLKIWLHREKLAATENPKAYIIRIVSNESVNYLRAQARNGKLLAALQPLAGEEAPSPEESLFYREMETQLNEAIERLPLACRKIYRMSREQYMRIPEIAHALNLSDSTVKNQLVKALKNLRRVVLFPDPDHRIFPIPGTAILLNPALKQNPG
ncbi:MAG TPA: RNA polymerase sigma-70 factor, partial [Puia sp.]|nr:RNA polymerase sigma-70 factor [Puia sp.]